MSQQDSPSDQDIRAAEELEFDTLDDLHNSNSQEPKGKGDNSPRSPSHKDKAEISPGILIKGSNLDPDTSFRSIPASSQNHTHHLATRSNSSDQRDAGQSTQYVDNEQQSFQQISNTAVVHNRESFAEVKLDEDPLASTSPGQGATTSQILSPRRHIDQADGHQGPLPPAVTQKPSFLSAALGFGATGSAESKSPGADSLSPLPSTSSAGTSNWRSTMTNLLGSRSTTTTSSALPSAVSPQEPTSAAQIASPHGSSSASFLLQRMASPTASRDRRISREVGATDKLREGFERVRLEMEGAAREMRREEISSPASTSLAPEGSIDWVFWGAVVQDYEEVARTQPKELSKAIQQGVPPVIRGAIWQLMSSSKSAPLEETYKALLKLPSPHEKAITKDINRTFPNHKYFKEGGGMGQESLYMVVKAYSLYDQEVGYTQGLAFIVAALLLNMPDEEAFCVLVRLMDSYNLRSHFLADMPGLQLRLFQFDRLVEEILPLLHTHLTRKGVKSSMFASQWFMTLFSYRFPLSLVYRVLDIVFAEGIEAIFRFSLALLRKSEDKLIELEFEQILSYLQTDLFQVYRMDDNDSSPAPDSDENERWRANDFVRDAYDVRITPFMLDSYESEYDEQQRLQHKHALELDQLRNANRNLSAQVKQLESSLATINQEHVELVRQLVMSKIDKEETENELVRYKMLYAELAHAQQDALSTHSRFSAGSSMSHMVQDSMLRER